MKEYTSTQKKYRNFDISSSSRCFHLSVEESDLYIRCENNIEKEMHQYLYDLRGQIKNIILLYPDFQTSFSPISLPKEIQGIAQEMCTAASIAQVGPMAAVAGAISYALVTQFKEQAGSHLIVENGGDLVLFSEKEQTVGLLAQPEKGLNFAIRVSPTLEPVAFCSSSGRIGHSVSFGVSDLVTVRWKNGARADAAVTALANMLKGTEDIERVIEHAQKLSNVGLDGIFIQYKDKIAIWGDMELVSV